MSPKGPTRAPIEPPNGHRMQRITDERDRSLGDRARQPHVRRVTDHRPERYRDPPSADAPAPTAAWPRGDSSHQLIESRHIIASLPHAPGHRVDGLFGIHRLDQEYPRPPPPPAPPLLPRRTCRGRLACPSRRKPLALESPAPAARGPSARCATAFPAPASSPAPASASGQVVDGAHTGRDATARNGTSSTLSSRARDTLNHRQRGDAS